MKHVLVMHISFCDVLEIAATGYINLMLSFTVVYSPVQYLFSPSAGLRCSHAHLPAVGSGCVRAGLQPVHRGPAMGALPRCPHGVQAGDSSSAVLLGHRLRQQHLPERPRL